MGSWAQVRSQARQLEGQTESLLQQYAQFASITNVAPKPTDEEQSLEKQLEDIFERRETTLTQLSRHLDTSPSPAPGAPPKSSTPDPKKGHLARHRQILSQHRSDLAQLRHQLSEKRGRAQLFQSVRRDVDNYRAADPATAEANYFLEERGRIDRSHQETDSVLARAYAVNEAMGLQREQLERVRRRALDVAGMVPGVNGLIGRIASKRRRDGVILGSFIAVCFLFVWFFS